MIRQPSHTAILVFSRTAKSEAQAKPLLRNRRQQARLSALMIEQTLRVVRATGLPYFFFSEKHQIDGDFGARLAHAFRSVFDRGYEQVICVGNDCLSLRRADLWAAHEALSQGTDAALGRATDGGAYLIGYRRAAFERLWPTDAAWQTPSVFTALLQRCRTHDASIFTLAEQTDVDSVAALATVVAQLVPRVRALIQTLLRAIATVRDSHQDANFALLYTHHAGMRAPPLAASPSFSGMRG